MAFGKLNLRPSKSKTLDAVPASLSEDPACRQMLDALGGGSTIIAPLPARGQTLGVLTLVRPRAEGLYDAAELALVEEAAYRAALVIDNTRLYHAERQARAEAEAAQEQLAQLVEVRERNRLARELHDNLAQTLGLLNLKVGLANLQLAENHLEELAANLHELKQVVAETYTDVREEIFDLRTKNARDAKFLETLGQYIDKYKRLYKMDIQLLVEADEVHFELPADIGSQLLRTIQETLINVRKHTQVQQASLRLNYDEERLKITIEDQGPGFNLAAGGDKQGSSFGLQIMRERMESVGGSLAIDSAPGRGARVILQYPAKK
jgi:signal transduction histidine kinase